MTKDSIRQIGVTAVTGIMLVNYALADILQYNGMSTLEATNKINIYFLPARFTYLIWGPIFLGLIAYTIFQALPAQKENQVLRKIGWWYIAGTLAISAWMVFLHFEGFLFTSILMILLLVSLKVIYEKLGIGLEKVSWAMRLFVHLPFSIYLGWITMETIGNVSNFLFHSNWNGFGVSAKIWAVVMMVVTTVIAELTAFNRQDLAYLAVFVWSFIGIAVNQIGVSPVFEAALVAAGFVIIMTAITIVVKPKLKKQI